MIEEYYLSIGHMHRARHFIKLHESHISALRSGELIKAHEILNEIQGLLFGPSPGFMYFNAPPKVPYLYCEEYIVKMIKNSNTPAESKSIYGIFGGRHWRAPRSSVSDQAHAIPSQALIAEFYSFDAFHQHKEDFLLSVFRDLNLDKEDKYVRDLIRLPKIHPTGGRGN
ncbi:hypothetical protein [Methylobacterium gregans]|uniref:hypothetical protein n=1 Tax=Methylobacterium gregans TaxID=374424 RepID=UPI001EE20A63|nr:hypothetical protein [Methylobacterium gregans]MDQ0520307.1 hypothetical protein [Methylobacterium gregans]GLS52710.1 hypothetical protein GCM10007886_08930 [Methylobacterium gregans]